MKTTTPKTHSERVYHSREEKVTKLVEDSQTFNDGPTYDALFDWLDLNRRGDIWGRTSRKLHLQHKAHLLRVLAEVQQRTARSLTYHLDH